MQTISYDVFKKDSGMLALMSYVSYVAQSKARDEIVNNVTFEISSQKMKIKSVIDSVDNLEALAKFLILLQNIVIQFRKY